MLECLKFYIKYTDLKTWKALDQGPICNVVALFSFWKISLLEKKIFSFEVKNLPKLNVFLIYNTLMKEKKWESHKMNIINCAYTYIKIIII